MFTPFAEDFMDVRIEDVSTEKVDVLAAAIEAAEAFADADAALHKVATYTVAYEVIETSYNEAKEGVVAGNESATVVFAEAVAAVEHMLGIPKGVLVSEATVAGFEEDNKEGEGKEKGDKEPGALEKVWKAIVNAAKKAWEFIKELWNKLVKFVKGLFGKGEDTASKVEKVEEEVKEAEKKAGKKAKVKDEKEITLEGKETETFKAGMAAYIFEELGDKDGKFTAQNIKNGLAATKKTLENAVKLREALIKAAKAVDKDGMKEAVSDAEKALSGASISALKLSTSLSSLVKSVSKSSGGDAAVYGVTPKKIFMTINKDGEIIYTTYAPKKLGNVKIKLAESVKDLEDIKNILKDIKNIVEKFDMEGIEKLSEQVKNRIENMKKAGEVDKKTAGRYKNLLTRDLPNLAKDLAAIVTEASKMPAIERYVEESKKALIKSIEG